MKKKKYGIELIDYTEDPDKANCLGDIIGASESMKKVYEDMIDFSKVKYNVLITGDTGTGKGMAARGIHNMYELNGRRKPMITVDCSAVPETLIESELFGHKKGAFTGANEKRKGNFLLADGSTLFIDEIGEAPINVQQKILIAVENKTIKPLGSDIEIPIEVDVRLIAATNKDIRKAIIEGKFKHDLYYRLSICRIHVPSLSERLEDISLLSRYLLGEYNEEYNRKKYLDSSALKFLERQKWPGNVRQLNNVIKSTATKARENRIKQRDIELRMDNVCWKSSDDAVSSILNGRMSLDDSVEFLERGAISEALEMTKGDKNRAARILDITPRSLRYRIGKYDIKYEFKLPEP